MRILFLGKYDENMRLLEEKIINIQEEPSSRKQLTFDKSQQPDVKKYQNQDCDIWVILGDVKPTILLKQLIIKTNIIFFVFNLANIETLDFLIKGWRPIIEKAGEKVPEYQERILIGINADQINYSDDKIIKIIENAMIDLGCKKYFGEGINIKNDKIGQYSVIPDLIEYTKGKIQDEKPKSQTKIHDDENIKKIDNENENKNNETNINNKKHEKVKTITINNTLYNILLEEKTAEIVGMQNINKDVIIPSSINYESNQYIITNICDHAFEGSKIKYLSFSKDSQLKSIGNYVFQQSTIERLSLPASLEILNKYWCKEADNLFYVEIDAKNNYFKNENGLLIYTKESESEILFAPKKIKEEFVINYSIGSYAFYESYGLQKLVIEGNNQAININDYSFTNLENLQSIAIFCQKGLSICQNSFHNCFSLSYISILNESEEDLTISKNAFQNCKSLTQIIINNKSKLILENEVFSNNNQLIEVILMGNEVIIGEKCFIECFKDINGTLKIKSNTKIEIGNNCFEGSYPNIVEITGKEISIKEKSFTKCIISNFTIIKSEKVFIEDFSFKDCILYTISLNKIGFINIKPNAFNKCKLREFIMDFFGFDASSFYNLKETIKAGELIKLLLLQKKETEELFVAKQILQKEEYGMRINKFISHILLLSKDDDSIITDFCGCGLIKFDSKSEEKLTIITKYYKNGSLSDVFIHQSLSDTEKYIILLGITYQMLFLHSNQFTYPNLNPDKILLDENYYPHLNVLGYSHTTEPTIYKPPCRFIEQKKDIYSFSIIIYELITGNKPVKMYTPPNLSIVKNYYIENFLKNCWSSNTIYIADFQDILNEITREQFINNFKVNEEKVINYIKMLKIKSLTQTIEIKDISFVFINFNKIANIISAKKILPKYRGYISENIYSFAKNYFSSLQSLEIANSEVNLAKLCFEYCNSLAFITIRNESEDDINFSKDIFQNCRLLKNIRIENRSKLILGKELFARKNNLEKIFISGNEIFIEDECFYKSFNNKNTEQNNIQIESKTFIEIGSQCFKDSYVGTIKITGEEVHIKEKSFLNCAFLINIDISDSNEVIIEKHAFKDCKKLNLISFNELEYFKIEPSALYGCNNIENINARLTKPFKSSKYYQSKGFIKKGNYSKIYYFQKNNTNEFYAAKVFMKKIPDENIDQFLNAMINISKDNNPAINNISEFGFFIFGQKPYFSYVTKYYKNHSLDIAIKKYISGTQKYIILLGITLGMQYLYSKKIRHQNLSSKKILLDGSFYPYLNNFDLMEPFKPNDIKQEIQSYAMIAYELMTGEVLSSSNNINEIITKKFQENKRIQTFFNKILTSNNDHYSSFSEIFNEINNGTYLSYFKADKNNISEYLNLFKIQIRNITLIRNYK